MPTKRKNTWYIDLRPPGYPHRIVRSCRTTSKRSADAMEHAVRELASKGRLDLLDALRAGKFSVPDLYAAKVADRLNELVSAQADPLLADAIAEFARDHPSRRLRPALAKILEVAPTGARLSWLKEPANLRTLLRHYRAVVCADSERREWAAVNGLIRDNYGEGLRVEIMRQVKLRRIGKPRDRHLSRDEIQRVEDVSGDWWLVIELALGSGLRQGEQLNLKVKDIDLEEGAVIVRSGKTRTARRRVPIAGRVLADLRGWAASQRLEPGDPLFPSLTLDRLRSAWEQIRELAGIPDVRWHDLRHTFAVFCAQAGVPMTTLKMWLGHDRLETTMRYSIYAPPERSLRYVAAMAEMGLSGDPRQDIPGQAIPTPVPTPEEAEELTIAGAVTYQDDPAPGNSPGRHHK